MKDFTKDDIMNMVKDPLRCVKCGKDLQSITMDILKCPDCSYSIIKSFVAWTMKHDGEYGKKMALKFITEKYPELLKELE